MSQEYSNERPIIGITQGDFNGVGPEIILKVLSDNRIHKICIPVIYGSYKVLFKYKKLLNISEDIHFQQIRSTKELNPKKNNLITCWEEDFEVNPGNASAESGKTAFLAIERAVDDALAKKIDALVTAPINKKNIQSNNFKFLGHTEYLSEKSDSEALMTMIAEDLRVALVTSHIPLAEVKPALTKEKIAKKLNTLYKSLKTDFGIIKPKIAVLGLNPHAGESGLLGTEEQEMIIPLIEEFKEKGLLTFGPYPADGFFGNQLYKKFDGILAMYHDQGLAPFKALAFDTGVNFSAGLSFIRTSPDHGTAYDIAGKNKASEDSLRHAIYLACDLVKHKKLLSV